MNILLLLFCFSINTILNRVYYDEFLLRIINICMCVYAFKKNKTKQKRKALKTKLT